MARKFRAEKIVRVIEERPLRALLAMEMNCRIPGRPLVFVFQRLSFELHVQDSRNEHLWNGRYWREADVGPRSARTTDHKEAVRAFIDKRKPAFVGQLGSVCRLGLNAVALYDDDHLI